MGINCTERNNLDDLPIMAWIIVNIKLVILVVPQKTTPSLTSFKMLRIFLGKQSQIVSVAQRLFDFNELLTYNFTYGMNVSPLSLKKYFPQCLLSNKVNVLNALNGFISIANIWKINLASFHTFRPLFLNRDCMLFVGVCR